jgi:hypothetical protein
MDQGSVAPFGIGWEEGEETVGGRIPVSIAETLVPGAIVEPKIAHVMLSSRLLLGRAAAPEAPFDRTTLSKDLMGLKKTNGKMRDSLDPIHRPGVDPQMGDEVGKNREISRLFVKKLEGLFPKVLFIPDPEYGSIIH